MLVDWSFLADTYQKAQQSDFWNYSGLFGDAFGGVIGTIITAISVALLYRTLKATNAANSRAHFRDIFSQMISVHQRAAEPLHTDNGNQKSKLKSILSEYYFIYRTLKKIESDYNISALTIQDRVNIAWLFTYYGPSNQCQALLVRYPHELIAGLDGYLCAVRNDEEWSGRLIGNQNYLGHYFRTLFAIYLFIDRFDALTKKEKYDFGKIVRVQLSNYEQAILALNAMSDLGTEWECKNLLSQYQIIKNIPGKFFTFDDKFEITQAFPKINFEDKMLL